MEAIKRLVDLLPPDQTVWDVLSGISIGSINAYGYSHFKPEDMEVASDALGN